MTHPATPLSVSATPWPQSERTAALPSAEDRGRGLRLTDRAVYRNGTGWVPVSGEVHYSRLPQHRWSERLAQVRAAGVSVVATYAFWNHHVADRGAPRFDGRLDIGAFVDAAADAGLDVVLRIGPWAHGEARNGGFPAWVQDAAVEHRSDDPAYLELVREWFGQLAGALAGRARPGGAVIGIQLENELYDRPEHIVTLKRLAREAGMSAPLWTATGWGGAQLPDGEVLPLFGGYADGFWVDPGDGWDPTFRAHFFPSHDWDDPGVGADVRAAQGFAAASATADLHGFPPATCELGGGMATAYHRRPVLDARDVAALAHVKIGNGSAWQGYYMFVGGCNPAPELQETIGSGYPNDLPEFGYDFHAPIGQSGDLAASAPLLRAQHAFLAAFGDRLSRMSSSLPDERPASLHDRTTLRWALRSDGDEGIVMVSHHQPFEQVADVENVRLRVRQGDADVVFPSAPVTVPAGTLARWPVGLSVGGTRVRWATASLLTILPAVSSRPATLVLLEDAGIAAELAVGDADPVRVAPGLEPHRFDDLDVLVVPAADADRLWVSPTAEPGLWLTLPGDELSWDAEGPRLRGASSARRYDPRTRSWLVVPAPGGDVAVRDGAGQEVAVEQVRAAGTAPAHYGFGGPRHRAPDAETIDALAAVWLLALPPGTDDGDADAVLEIDWAGDVGQLRVDGTTVDDRFWDGTRWSVSVRDAGITADTRVTLHIVPLSSASTVALAADARERRAEAAEPLMAATLRSRGPWRRLRAD